MVNGEIRMDKMDKMDMMDMYLSRMLRVATSPKQGRSTLGLMVEVIFGAPMFPSASWFVMRLTS